MGFRRAMLQIQQPGWPTRAVGLCLLIVMHFTLVSAQAARQGTTAIRSELQPGVVVESVRRGWGADRAGLKESDIIVQWSQGDASGLIRSPLDLMVIELERKPAGPIVVAGFRAARPQVWTLGIGQWELKTRPNLSGVALSSYKKALLWIRRREPIKAADSFEAVIKRLQGLHAESVLAWLGFRSAAASADGHRPEAANEAFGNAIAQADTGGGFLSPVLQMRWADLQPDLQYAEALDQRALQAVVREQPEGIFSAGVLQQLGVNAVRRGDLVAARAYFERAIAILEKPGSQSADLVLDLGMHSMADAYEGNLVEAQHYALRAFKIQEATMPHDSPEVSATLLLLGNVAWYRGELAHADAYYRRSLAIEQRIKPGSTNEPSCLVGLGLVARKRGDLARAEKYYLSALAMVKKSGPSTYASIYTADILGNLGSVFLDSGDLHTAEQYYRQALTMREKFSPMFDVVDALNELGEVSEKQGDLGAAEAYLQRALTIQEKAASGSGNPATTLATLGAVAAHAMDFTKAEGYYRRAISIEAKLFTGGMPSSATLSSLAAVLRRKGQFEDAAFYYDQALEALEHQTAILGGRSDIQAGFRAKHEKTYREYIDLLVLQNKPESALTVLERSRARTLLETLASGHIDILKGADPILLEKQRSLQTDIKAKSERRIRVLSTKRTDRQIQAIEKEIRDLTAEYQDVEAQIRISNPGYAALTQPQPLTAQEIQQQLLNPDTLLLEYSLGEERSYLFAVTRDSLEAFPLPRRAEIEKAARRVYDLVRFRSIPVRGKTVRQKRHRLTRSESALSNAVSALSKMVLGPVADQLKNKRLLIVADGALAYVPFSVLTERQVDNSETAKSADRKPTPLMVHHEIIYLPSASVLAVLRQQQTTRPQAAKAVAVLADPVFDKLDPRVAARSSGQPQAAATANPKRAKDDLLEASFATGLLTRSAAEIGLSRSGRLQLPRLRYSRQEADAILAVTPPGSGLKAVDFQASRDTAVNAELSQYRIVHFATHGLINSEHPELSGLVLSLVDKNGNPQEGFLELQDIYNMNLSADLVVLSACETGLGKEISGEGLIGMTRGFMYAGANRVVASLWNVSDVATAQLMAEFYRAMEKDHLSPAAALRSAQIWMWRQKRWRSPYYWAAFQIQGEWK